MAAIALVCLLVLLACDLADRRRARVAGLPRTPAEWRAWGERECERGRGER